MLKREVGSDLHFCHFRVAPQVHCCYPPLPPTKNYSGPAPVTNLLLFLLILSIFVSHKMGILMDILVSSALAVYWTVNTRGEKKQTLKNENKCLKGSIQNLSHISYFVLLYYCRSCLIITMWSKSSMHVFIHIEKEWSDRVSFRVWTFYSEEHQCLSRPFCSLYFLKLQTLIIIFNNYSNSGKSCSCWGLYSVIQKMSTILPSLSFWCSLHSPQWQFKRHTKAICFLLYLNTFYLYISIYAQGCLKYLHTLLWPI